MIELGAFTASDGKKYDGHFHPENKVAEAIGPLPVDGSSGARGVAFSVKAESEKEAIQKLAAKIL